MVQNAPLIVEVTRGDLVESRHRVAVAVVHVSGDTVSAAGDAEALVYPRSAIKPLQALPLVETGAAAAFGLGDAEIALACASHGGEKRHVDAVRTWLAALGLTEDALECGTHLPNDPAASRALLRSGGRPSPAHNNCSGKHTGFLTVARHMGYPTKGYIGPDHPVQRMVMEKVAALAGARLEGAPRGFDGCGIPVFGVKLSELARAMSRFGAYDDPACARIRGAMAAEPLMVAGTGRFNTRLIEATRGRVLAKEGAEGVFCAAVPALGLGIAVKAEDGAGRAASAALANVLLRNSALTPDEAETLREAIAPVLRNHAEREIGRIRVV